MPSSQIKSFVGIDVSKSTLDICILPQREQFKVENNHFESLCQRLQSFSPELIVLESTGGYELGVYRALTEAGYRVSREHPLNIYHHRKSRGKRAKTDGIDAETLAHYAQCYTSELRAKEPLNENQERLRQFMARRAELVEMQTAEKNRLKSPANDSEIKEGCIRMLESIQKEIIHLETRIQEEINDHFKEKQQLLMTVPGIGKIVANALLAWLPELGKIGNKQIAALVGVAPYHHESGQYKGERHIHGGRTPVRCALYMAALSATRANPSLQSLFHRLVSQGKAKKVALIACVHKLLRMVNAMLRKQETFQPA